MPVSYTHLFPVPSCYAHPIVRKQMTDAIEEGRAVTVPEALDAVEARLLQSRGIRAAAYHAKLDAEVRRKNQDDFLYDLSLIHILRH